MKEKILRYLEAKPEPASAQELVREILKIQQPSERVSRRLIAELLGSDPRFRVDARGVTLAEPPDRRPAEPASLLADTQWAIVGLDLLPSGPAPMDIAWLAAIRARGNHEEDRFLTWTAVGRQRAIRELGLSAEESARPIPDRELIAQYCRFIQGAIWVSFEPRRDLERLNARLQSEGLPLVDPVALGLRALVQKLFPGESVRTAEQAAACVGAPWADVSQPDLQVRMAAEVLFRILDLVEELGITTLDDLIAFQNRGPEPVDWSRFQFDSRFLAAIPKQPGVYFFTDRAGVVLYVGKAKNLNSRVQSYFHFTRTEEEKKRALHQSAYNLTYEVTGSELEALLREAEAIKALRPAINMQLEVYEREAERGHYSNAILILPAKEAGYAELFLVRQDKALEQMRVARDLSEMTKAARRLKRFFARKKGPPADQTWKAEILWRWLKKNRDKVLVIDSAGIADMEECLRLLRRYVQEPAGAEKVIYR